MSELRTLDTLTELEATPTNEDLFFNRDQLIMEALKVSLEAMHPDVAFAFEWCGERIVVTVPSRDLPTEHPQLVALCKRFDAILEVPVEGTEPYCDDEGMRKLKHELLEKYRNRDPKRFTQFDVFVDWGADSLADEDGYGVFRLDTHELMSGSDVRVLIDPDADPQKVLIGLRKTADWIERDQLNLPDVDEPMILRLRHPELTSDEAEESLHKSNDQQVPF